MAWTAPAGVRALAICCMAIRHSFTSRIMRCTAIRCTATCYTAAWHIAIRYCYMLRWCCCVLAICCTAHSTQHTAAPTDLRPPPPPPPPCAAIAGPPCRRAGHETRAEANQPAPISESSESSPGRGFGGREGAECSCGISCGDSAGKGVPDPGPGTDPGLRPLGSGSRGPGSGVPNGVDWAVASRRGGCVAQ